MSDNKLEINGLDFLTIRSNLKNYLANKEEFSDFNFEGSGISILLDLLAYTTHYLSFYNNMVANEMFLDSAIKRSSVVSHAKALGYTPASRRAATATLNVVLTPEDMNGSYTLAKRSKFVGSKDGISYTFYTTSTATFVANTSTTLIANNVEVKEGTYRKFSYVVDTGTSQKIIIPEKNVDISTLTVAVQTSATNTTGSTDTWTNVTDITTVSSTTKAFFVQELQDGRYEVYFGDGVIGQAVEDGNVVVLDYLVTSGLDANGIGSTDRTGARAFSTSVADITDVVVVSASSGGANKESIDSIKFNAPRAYQSQNRAVTASDYASFVQQNFSKSGDVFVWGGEDSNPPEYGKVFISVKPSSGTVLTFNEKLSLQNLIKDKNVVGIIPEVVDPNYLYLKINSTVAYDADATTKTSTDIKEVVKIAVLAYSLLSLEKFNRSFRYSKFVAHIDDSDTAIVGNQTFVTIEKRIEPTVGVTKNYTVKFENEIYHPHDGHSPVLTSNGFVYTKSDGTTSTCYLDDDGSGKIRIYENIANVRSYIVDDIGTIDYTTGILSLKSFVPLSVTNGGILKLEVIPNNKDIISERNTIISIDAGDTSAIVISAQNYDPYSTTVQQSTSTFSSIA